MEAMRCLKRRISDSVNRQLVAGARDLAVDPTTDQVWVAGDGAVTVLE